MKKTNRKIEDILEDILQELKIKNNQQSLPPYQIILPNTPSNIDPLHYHGNGIPCRNNPCVWC